MKRLSLQIATILILTAAVFSTHETAMAAVNCSDPEVICKSGILAADETWTPDNLYVITGGDLTVPAGVTLIIQAGTIVKFDLGRDLIVEGTFTANGTEENPVYFTSVRDDTLGGDTNHDTTLPSPGDWDRLYYRDNSSGTLTYVEFRYGGDDYNNFGMLHTDAASVTVDHGVFKNSAQCAINSHPAYEVTLTNMTPADLTGNRFNGLCLRGGALNQNAVWDETEVAYVLLGDLTIASAQSLTWSAGIVIKPVSGNVDIIVDGTLNANGTSSSPVYVTSIHDDTLGGNTDNQTTAPAAGHWDRLYYRDNSSGTLTYVEFRYGGDDYNNFGMLHTDAASVTVDHGVFKNSAQCAINSHPAYEVTLTNMTPADLTGNRFNGLCLRGGALNQNAVWDETEVAYVLLGDLTIASAQSLTWSAGIVIKPVSGNVDIIVDGTLNANGTSSSPVYVTSIHDDTLGGNTDNQTTTPAAGHWNRIYFRTGSAGTLTYIQLRYGKNAAIYISESSPSIRNCVLRWNVIGIRVIGFTANPTIKECMIFGNQQYGVYNDTTGHWIDATNNWWGSNSGPYDPSSSGTDGDYNNGGSGDRVNDYILYRPWLRIGFDIFLPLIRR